MDDLYLELDSLGFVLDLRHSGLDRATLEASRAVLEAARVEMQELEGGALAESCAAPLPPPAPTLLISIDGNPVM